MQREEVKQMLTILKASYPNTYKNMTKEEAVDTLNLYYEFFNEYDIRLVVIALKNYIKKNQYPPTIAGLTEQIELISSKESTDIELWNLVEKASRNSYYCAKEEFDKLPLVCQKWLGSPNQLREIGQCDADKVQQVTRGQFLKSIGELKDREKALERVPGEVSRLLSKTRMLEGAND